MCKELGAANLNNLNRFTPQLIISLQGFTGKIGLLSKFNGDSLCRSDYTEDHVHPVRKLFQLKGLRGQILDRLPLDVSIPNVKGAKGPIAFSFNKECSKLYNRKLLIISVKNPYQGAPSYQSGEPTLCLGFMDKELKKLRLVLSHQQSGGTMVDYE